MDAISLVIHIVCSVLGPLAVVRLQKNHNGLVGTFERRDAETIYDELLKYFSYLPSKEIALATCQDPVQIYFQIDNK